jgi:hypothetical protein
VIIGLRIVLLLGLLTVAAPLLAYIVTRNRRYYTFALKAGKIVLVVLAAIALIYIAERLVLI